MLTKEKILEKAAELYEENGFVHIGILAKALDYNYGYVYKHVTQMKQQRKWPYRKNTCKRIYKESLFGQVRSLYVKNPYITAIQAFEYLKLPVDRYVRVREYLLRIRKSC